MRALPAIARPHCPAGSLSHGPATGHDTRRRRGNAGRFGVLLLAIGAVHGKASQYPLRWSDAAALPHGFSQQLALNPLHNLYDTWTFRDQRIDDVRIAAVRALVRCPYT